MTYSEKELAIPKAVHKAGDTCMHFACAVGMTWQKGARSCNGVHKFCDPEPAGVFSYEWDLQGRVSGQVTPCTEPEMPVLSFHSLLSWLLGNAARQSAAKGGFNRDAAVSGAAFLAGHMQGPSTCFPWATVC